MKLNKGLIVLLSSLLLVGCAKSNINSLPLDGEGNETSSSLNGDSSNNQQKDDGVWKSEEEVIKEFGTSFRYVLSIDDDGDVKDTVVKASGDWALISYFDQMDATTTSRLVNLNKEDASKNMLYSKDGSNTYNRVIAKTSDESGCPDVYPYSLIGFEDGIEYTSKKEDKYLNRTVTIYHNEEVNTFDETKQITTTETYIDNELGFALKTTMKIESYENNILLPDFTYNYQTYIKEFSLKDDGVVSEIESEKASISVKYWDSDALSKMGITPYEIDKLSYTSISRYDRADGLIENYGTYFLLTASQEDAINYSKAFYTEIFNHGANKDYDGVEVSTPSIITKNNWDSTHTIFILTTFTGTSVSGTHLYQAQGSCYLLNERIIMTVAFMYSGELEA